MTSVVCSLVFSGCTRLRFFSAGACVDTRNHSRCLYLCPNKRLQAPPPQRGAQPNRNSRNPNSHKPRQGKQVHTGGRPARKNRRPRTAAGQAIPAGTSREGLSRTTRLRIRPPQEIMWQSRIPTCAELRSSGSACFARPVGVAVFREKKRFGRLVVSQTSARCNGEPGRVRLHRFSAFYKAPLDVQGRGRYSFRCFRSAYFGLFLAGFGLFWGYFRSFGRTSWGFVNRPAPIFARFVRSVSKNITNRKLSRLLVRETACLVSCSVSTLRRP